MRIAITGGSGFIGGAVLHRLVNGMEASLSVTVRALASSVASGERLRARFPNIEVVDLYRADGTVSASAFQDCDVFLHCGWSTVPSTAELDPQGDLRTNVEGGAHMIEAAARGGVRRVLFLSSGGMVYGEAAYLPIDEAHPVRPINAYGAAKLCMELYLAVRAAHHRMEHLILRPSNVYGRSTAHDRPQGVIEHWMIRILRGEPLETWNDLAIVRDYLHIDDLVDLIITGLSAPITEPVLNVGTGKGTTLIELIRSISEVAGVEPAVVVRPSGVRTVLANVLDAGRAERMVGFAPQVTLEQGLQRTWTQLIR